MKYITTVFLVLLLTVGAQAHRYTIGNSGVTFSPSSLTVEVGDSIYFQLSPSHNAVEVSQSTWDANGSTSNGGFEVPFGGGLYVPQSTGIIYYVCAVHASLGMKGTITVQPKSTTGIQGPPPSAPTTLLLHQNIPNPMSTAVSGIISFSSSEHGPALLRVYDLLGAERATLFQGTIERDRTYDVRIDAGSLPAGVYLYRLEQGSNVATRVMTLTK